MNADKGGEQVKEEKLWQDNKVAEQIVDDMDLFDNNLMNVESLEMAKKHNRKFMHDLQEHSDKVSCFFQHKKLKYIQDYGC